MDTLLGILLVVGLSVLGGIFGTDSRPANVTRATRWWPATPRRDWGA